MKTIDAIAAEAKANFKKLLATIQADANPDRALFDLCFGIYNARKSVQILTSSGDTQQTIDLVAMAAFRIFEDALALCKSRTDLVNATLKPEAMEIVEEFDERSAHVGELLTTANYHAKTLLAKFKAEVAARIG